MTFKYEMSELLKKLLSLSLKDKNDLEKIVAFIELEVAIKFNGSLLDDIGGKIDELNSIK